MSQSKDVEVTELDEAELPESKVLDHLGLVAGIFEELEIGDRIDEHIAQDLEEREVSVGQAVKAMVLNGFGFVQQRLYLTPEFFEKVPTERLIGEGVCPKNLNEGVLGRALDDLLEYGVTELFRDVAAHAAEKLGLGSRFAHLDATSFSFHGEYDSDGGPTRRRHSHPAGLFTGQSPGPESGCPRHDCRAESGASGSYEAAIRERK
jgi:transposase